MKQTDIAWAAGFFDGEGTVFVSKQKRVPHPERENTTCYPITSPVVSVAQVRPEPLFRFAKIVGGRKPGGPHKSSTKNGQPYYRWDACGRPSTCRVLTLLWPYLSKPKKEQARRVWAELKKLKRLKSPPLPSLPRN